MCTALASLGCSTFIRELPSLTPDHNRSPKSQMRLPFLNFEHHLSTLISTEKIQVVHTHNIHQCHGPGVPQAIANVCARLGVVPVTTVHDIGLAATHPAERLRTMELLNRSRCITTSAFNERQLRTTMGVTVAAIIPPGISFDRFTDPGVLPDLRSIAFPGRLIPGKGGMEAVVLLGLLSRELGDLTINFSDPTRGAFGQRDEFIALLEREAARFPDLHITFAAPDAPMLNLYLRSAMTLVMPKQTEGFGMVPLESLACGRPVVAAPTGGMSWLTGISGVQTITAANIIELSSAITNVLNDWTFWRAQAVKTRDILLSRYDIAITASAHLELYRSLLSRSI
jgi:D-inositol-3-phosphate glycosyltransferase